MTKDEDFKLIKTQTFVLKVYIHCEGCSKKVKKVLQNIEGVFTTTVDAAEQKVTVTGNVPSADILVKKLLKAGKHAELWPQKSNNSSNKGKQQQDDLKPSPPPQQQQQKEKKASKDDGGGGDVGGDASGGAKKGKKGGGGGGEKGKSEDAEESGGEGSKGGGGAPPNEGGGGGGGGGGGKKKKGGKGGGGGGGAGGGGGNGEGMSIIEPSFDADDFPVLGQVAQPMRGFNPMPPPGFGPVAHGGFGPMGAGGVGHMGGAEWPGMPPVAMQRPMMQYVQYVPQYPTVYTQPPGHNEDYASHMFNDENTSSCAIM